MGAPWYKAPIHKAPICDKAPLWFRVLYCPSLPYASHLWLNSVDSAQKTCMSIHYTLRLQHFFLFRSYYVMGVLILTFTYYVKKTWSIRQSSFERATLSSVYGARTGNHSTHLWHWISWGKHHSVCSDKRRSQLPFGNWSKTRLTKVTTRLSAFH